MTSERFQQLKAIVADASEEQSPSKRAELVAERCGGDQTLVREVESLLAETTDAMESYAEKATGALRRDSAPLAAGLRIGAYAIVRELGRGGMGAVYLAKRADGVFDKQVAVKLLKRGTDTDEVLRRFGSERRILARLEHANIARLLDGGTTDDGLPYFVMDYVDGKPITKYADEHQLPVIERLKLFRVVCAAVSYAHQNLIIHRDIKPGNVLVTDKAEVKLLDFGIAKIVQEEGSELEEVTLTKLRILTPEYASPEQARGEPVTTVSDVYALGVLLYELLTGSRPYKLKHRSADEITRAICDQEPERPSASVATGSEIIDGADKVRRQLRGDLDNIILKALRKEPQRRYASVDQFSEDIRRHLEGLPIRARKETPAYRTSKFIQRHKLGVAAAALLLLAMLGGIAATLQQAHVARMQRTIAEERFNEVREMAHSVMFDYNDAIATLAGSTAVRERLVKDSLKYLDKLAQRAGDDRALLRELATAYEKVGQIQGNSYYVNLGDTGGAIKSYGKSLTIRKGLLAADPSNREIQSELASSHEGIGDMLYTIGDLRGALKGYERALELLRSAFATDSANLANRLSLSELYTRMGDLKGMEIYANLGDTAGALDSYRNAEDLIETLSDANPQNQELRAALATILMRVGMLSDTTGDITDALEKERKAIALLEELAASYPNNKSYIMDLLEANSFLRYVFVDSNQIAKAIERSQKTIATLQSISATDPKDISVRRDLEVVYNALGEDLLISGDVVGALENHRTALSISQRLLASDPQSEVNKSDLALTLHDLGKAQTAAHDYRSALENYRRSLEIRQAALTADASNVRARSAISTIHADIGNTLTMTGDIQGALTSFAQAVPLSEEVLAHSPANAKLRARVARRYQEVGQLHEKIAQAHAHSATGDQAQWKVAREWFQKSLNVWREMKSKGTLNGADASKVDEVAREIARCDAAL